MPTPVKEVRKGKLVKTECRWLLVIAIILAAGAIALAYAYLKSHDGGALAGFILSGAMATFLFYVYHKENHPEVPPWIKW